MFLNTYIIKYLDLYHDRETKHLYFIMEYYEVYIFEIKTLTTIFKKAITISLKGWIKHQKNIKQKEFN